MAVPDVLITRGGTQIHYGARLSRDQGWSRHISYNWQGDRVYDLLAETQGVRLAPRSKQGLYAVHADIDQPTRFIGLIALADLFHAADISVRLTAINDQEFLATPQRASKGFAIRYLSAQHDIALNRMLVVGGVDADYDLLGGNTLNARVFMPDAVPASASPSDERQEHAVFHPTALGVQGILGALEYYDFFGDCRAPNRPDSVEHAAAQLSDREEPA
jgi:sucrose-phosphate synthase